MIESPEQTESSDLFEVKVAAGGSRTVIGISLLSNIQPPAAALVVTLYFTPCLVVNVVVVKLDPT